MNEIDLSLVVCSQYLQQLLLLLSSNWNLKTFKSVKELVSADGDVVTQRVYGEPVVDPKELSQALVIVNQDSSQIVEDVVGPVTWVNY